MRSLATLPLILATALLLSAAFIVVKTQPHPSDQPQTNQEVLPPHPSDRKSSHRRSLQACEQLRAILLEEITDQDSGAIIWGKFLDQQKRAQSLISTLSKTDCLELLAKMESGELKDALIHRIYERLGELAPHLALAHLGESPGQLPKDSPHKISLKFILQGWSTHQPADAWTYCKKSGIKDQYHVSFSGNVITFDSHTSAIFQNWSRLDHETAFRHLAEVPSENLRTTLRAYIHGLPTSSDFHQEAKRLTQLEKENPTSPESLSLSQFLSREHDLELSIASRWMNSNPDEASQYWLAEKKQSNPESHSNQDALAADRADKLGQLIKEWIDSSSTRIDTIPQQATDWILTQPGLTQHPPFQRNALPALAQKSPQHALTLIREIDSIDHQVQFLITGISAPSESVLPTQGRMTNTFTPEMIQQEIATGRFTGENLTLLKSALADRQAYEAGTKN